MPGAYGTARQPVCRDRVVQTTHVAGDMGSAIAGRQGHRALLNTNHAPFVLAPLAQHKASASCRGGGGSGNEAKRQKVRRSCLRRGDPPSDGTSSRATFFDAGDVFFLSYLL